MKFVFCMSKYPGAKFAREFRRKRDANPISFSAKSAISDFAAKSVRSSKLCPLGEIVLKARIAFQKVMGEIDFHGDLVWVKFKWTRPWFWLSARVPRDAPAPSQRDAPPTRLSDGVFSRRGATGSTKISIVTACCRVAR